MNHAENVQTVIFSDVIPAAQEAVDPAITGVKKILKTYGNKLAREQDIDRLFKKASEILSSTGFSKQYVLVDTGHGISLYDFKEGIELLSVEE